MKQNQKDMVYNVRDVSTFKELIEGSAELYGERTAFLFKEGEVVREVTYSEYMENIKALAVYLRSRFPEGSKIAVSGKNSYAWALTYLAVACGVGVIVPLDKDLREDEFETLLADSESVAIMYSEELREKMPEGKTEGCAFLCMCDLDEYLTQGRALIASGDRSYEEHKIDPFVLGILLYTSGTTGVSKGVMLSQHNICSDLVHVLRRAKVYPEDRALSIAPLHHTYEATAGFLAMMFCGSSIAYNDSLRKLQTDLKVYRPTILFAVPLILETFRNLIIKKYKQLKGGNIILALQRAAAGISNEKTKKSIFSVVNETFGGRLRLIVCGAALLSPEVFKDYERFGIRVLIGYGLTETSPVCLMHSDFYRSPYDIGYPIVGLQVRLDDVNDDGIGELVVKGSNVMLGYYKNPDETAKVMEDGWFHTGDLAKMLPNGAYSITGRIKSMIVTPGGKKVFPEELEYFIGNSQYVAECMVYGIEKDGAVQIAVSIYPNYEEVNEKLLKSGITVDSDGYNEAVFKLFSGIVRDVNAKFPAFKSIRHIVIRHSEFDKTTTKKIRRNSPENISEGKGI